MMGVRMVLYGVVQAKDGAQGSVVRMHTVTTKSLQGIKCLDSVIVLSIALLSMRIGRR